MDVETYEIDSIGFGIYTAQELLAISVCKVDSTKHSGPGSVYDPRMGTTDQSKTCETCNETAITCPGHFGHIELNEPIIHPLFFPRVESFLRCFCVSCHRLLISKDQLLLLRFNRFRVENRFNHLLDYFKKIDICCWENCMADQPTYKYSSSDSSISQIYTFGKDKTSIVMTVEEIKKIFENISDEDVELLGFNPKVTHPCSLILTVIPVLPPCDRPYVQANGNIGDDDLTIQYMEIVKQNNLLTEEVKVVADGKAKKPMNAKTKGTALKSLQFRFATLLDNSKGKIKHTTNSRPYKGIKERMTAKSGLVRGAMMGKRVDFSGRTVIGSDPTLKFDELGVPEEMARVLTVPVKVNKVNFDEMLDVINNGRANQIQTMSRNPEGKMSTVNLTRMLQIYGTMLLAGDVIHRGQQRIPVVTGKEVLKKGDKIMRDGKFLDDVKYPGRRVYNKLQIGDIVHRQLRDGDYVLLNRQPTLQKESMQAMKVRINKYKTLKFNLAITKPFNADFDKQHCRKQVA